MRTYTRLMLGFLLITFSFHPAAPGQALTPQEEAALWTFKAESLSEALAKDAASLEASDRALLYLQLGIIWWQDDPVRARAFMSRAIEVITTGGLAERPAERGRRLGAARKILQALEARDKELGAKLAEALASTGEQFSGDDNAEALVSAALAVAAKDPGRAASIGAQALRAGRGILSSGSFFRLLRVLLASDEASGNKLFAHSLALAQAEHDETLTSTIAYVAFPAAFSPSAGKSAVPSRPLRVQTLKLLAENLMRAADPAEEAAACRSAPLMTQLSEEFGRLLPEVAPRVFTQVRVCQPRLDAYAREAVIGSEQQGLTAEEHLKKFREGTERGPRLWHLMRALDMVERARDFDRGISTLDGLTDKERPLLGETWNGLRVKFATAAAHDAFKGGNFIKMYQVIEAVPGELRPMTQTFLARQISTTKPEVSIDLLEAARRGLAKFPLSEPPPSGIYFVILDQYAVLNSSELLSVFREAAAAIDLFVSKSSGKDATPEESLDPVNLSPALLHLYDHDAEQTAAAMKNTRARVLVRLGLVQSSLQQKHKLRAGKAAPNT